MLKFTIDRLHPVFQPMNGFSVSACDRPATDTCSASANCPEIARRPLMDAGP